MDRTDVVNSYSRQPFSNEMLNVVYMDEPGQKKPKTTADSTISFM